MNFLSHYFFEKADTTDFQVLGVVLPDLLRNSKAAGNIHPEKKPQQFDDSQTLQAVLAGWQRHLSVDKVFHSSTFFIEQTQLIKQDLKPILLSSPIRPSFLAHISLELLLDHLLLVNNKIVVSKFYQYLEACDIAEIRVFLQRSGLSNDELFFKFFENFIKSKYLFSYDKIENICYALMQICKRVWPDLIDDVLRIALAEVLELHKIRLQDNFMSIFDQIDECL